MEPQDQVEIPVPPEPWALRANLATLVHPVQMVRRENKV